tara:strand:- start:62 stop:838 length:777 start_codon:yes stop_codon:yes gene_type:complete
MRRILTFIFLLFSINNLIGQDCNIGNQDSNGFDNAGDPIYQNFLLGVKFNLSDNGILNSLNLIGRNTGAQVKMAVYDDLNGVPNDLIVISNIGVVGEGILSLPVPNTNLTPGNYWIMAIYDEDGGHTFNTYSDPGNFVYFKSLNFGDDVPANAGDFESFPDSDITYFMEITCGVLGLSNMDFQNEVQIWPNPAKKSININAQIIIEELKILDISGREIKYYKPFSNEFTLEVSDLESGTYLVIYKTPELKAYTKFIKK